MNLARTVPGSARLQQAGFGILPKRTFSEHVANPHGSGTNSGFTVRDSRKRSESPARCKRALPRFLAGALFILSNGAAFAESPQAQIAARAGLDQHLNTPVPLDLTFRDEHGNAVRLGDYFGSKPVILALAYYQCPNLCTLVLNGVLQTAQELKFDAGKDYQIVVVSFDPRERPALAAAKKQIYLERYGRAHAAAGWHFLTGAEPSIAQLADAIGYRYAWDAETRQFAHPSAITVLTPTGKISRYFPGIEYPPREVRLALLAASNNQTGSFVDRVFLLCFHYNPSTGKYGLVISRVMQIAGTGTALLLAGYVAMMIRRERRPT